MDAPEFLASGASPFCDWLASVGLGHLAPLLQAHDIAEDVIAALTEQDLSELGLSMGDRKRLKRAIARLTDVGVAHVERAAALPAHASTHANPSTNAHTELRQLTIMFCDLVDATALSARLSPESWREVVLSYQQTAVAVITRHGGSVAQYLGDGLLVYFGYPRAQEDAAVRAVQAGLELVQALSELRITLDTQGAVTLQTRIGLHTGMVVMGDIGVGERREQLALGETPNIAARLQELATPATVLITEATRRLVAGSFLYEDLGQHLLKGVQAPRQVWRVLGSSGVPSRFDARSRGGVSPLVGRTQELGLLLDRWHAAVQGQGQVVLISGEAGMGKSRMLKELRERLGDAGRSALWFQCAAHRADSAFHALAESLTRALRIKPDMATSLKLDRIDALVRAQHGLSDRHAALMAAMLGIPQDGRHELAPSTPHLREQDIIDVVRELVEARAAQGPLLLFFEDAHWADPASLAALNSIVAHAKGLPLLLLITHRPEFTLSFDRQAHVTALKMPGLRRSDVAALVSHLMGGQQLPAAMAQRIQHRTDGVPLFVEEVTRALLEQPSAQQRDIAAFLPATLRDSLMARLERHPGAKALAQIGSAIGREFSHDLLRAVWEVAHDAGDEALLQQGIDALVEAGLILRYDMQQDAGCDDGGQTHATYVFKHALVQDAAYDTLPSARKEALHARILQALQQCQPETGQTQPALFARHAMAAGQPQVALIWWRHASELALERLALHEAAAHLQAALQASAKVPASTQRDQTDLQLHTALGTVHMRGKGWAAAEAEEAYRRASRHVGAASSGEEAIWPLWGLCMHHLMRGGLTQAQAIGQRMQVVAEQAGARQAQFVVDMTHTLLHGHGAQFAKADTAWQQGLQRHSEAQDRALLAQCSIDLMLMAAVQRLHAQWITGVVNDVDVDAAYAEIEQRALELGHPFTLAWVSICGAMIYLHADQPDSLLPRLHRGQHLAQTHGFTWLTALATFAMGWCQSRIDDLEEGTAMMAKGLAAYKATGAGLMLPCLLALLAQAQGRAGWHTEAMETLSRAWRCTEQGGERWHEAELHRIRGELLATAPAPDLRLARHCHEQAIGVAASQGAHRWLAQARQAMAELPQDEMGRSADLAS